jgi:hypothetical protein
VEEVGEINGGGGERDVEMGMKRGTLPGLILNRLIGQTPL